jgi:aspartate aminotransferase-like enzyme
MEMALTNLFNPGEQVISINAGTFGAKWAPMARSVGLQVNEIRLPLGKDLDLDHLINHLKPSIRGLLLTAHETSTGQRFDIKSIAELASKKNILAVVDCVSSLGADPFEMDAWGVDCAIGCSQKALACTPGLVFVAFSEKALHRVNTTRNQRAYLDARIYIENIGRGMLPYTPAIHATYQVHRRLELITALGLEQYIDHHREKATALRKAVSDSLGWGLFPETPSNALSAITLPKTLSASTLTRELREQYDLILPLNPTGSESYIRISHMGNQKLSDLEYLVQKIALIASNSELSS